MEGTMRRKLEKLLAPAVILMITALVWQRTGIFFETNDDKCITEILSGVLTGEPDGHAEYVNYCLALPVSLLYRITAKVPWYGLFLVFFQILAYTGILMSICSRCEKLWGKLLGTLTIAAVILSNLYLLGCIQYTSTAALLAAAGYFCLLAHSGGRSRWLWFATLELLSCSLRINAMLMMQPMGILTAAGLILTGGDAFAWKGVSGRKGICKILIEGGCILAVLASVLLLVTLTNAAGYRGDAWKRYRQYDEARAVLFDYGSAPDYGEVKAILDRYQATETDYDAFRNYIMLDWAVSPECARELAAYARESREKPDFRDLVISVRQNLLEDSHWGINRVLAVLWLAAAVMALMRRSLKEMAAAFCMSAGKIFSWGYLLYRGRLPLRVSMPLLAGEGLLLLALLIRAWSGERGVLLGGRTVYGIRICVCALLLSGFFLTCCQSGVQQYRYILSENNGQRVMMEAFREIEAYCSASPDKRFILDAVSVSYFRGSALETEGYQDRNNIISGNWYFNSPGVRKHNREYLSGADGVYFLVFDDGRGKEHPGVRWLAQETGASPVLYDSFTASHGGVYLIYYFDGELCIGKDDEA